MKRIIYFKLNFIINMRQRIKFRIQMKLSEEQWKKKLTSKQYHVLRERGTELPFTGKFNNHREKGIYTCAACGNRLFSSNSKYNSRSGWSSFFRPLLKENIKTKQDKSLFMNRTEVLCKVCGGHLGHVFSDGPKPTGKRYCINSAALDFKKDG